MLLGNSALAMVQYLPGKLREFVSTLALELDMPVELRGGGEGSIISATVFGSITVIFNPDGEVADVNIPGEYEDSDPRSSELRSKVLISKYNFPVFLDRLVQYLAVYQASLYERRYSSYKEYLNRSSKLAISDKADKWD